MTMRYAGIAVCFTVVTIGLSPIAPGQNKYVGVKTCGMCHKAQKQGNQLSVWQGSAHAQAFKTLTGAGADSIARVKGLAKPASESKECLQCHAVGYEIGVSLADKNFDYKDGVQCEACHGPGSGYKTIPVMKDNAKAIAAGLHEFKDEKEIDKFCRTCHNEKSPMYKGFNFKDLWEKIKHPRPKG